MYWERINSSNNGSVFTSCTASWQTNPRSYVHIGCWYCWRLNHLEVQQFIRGQLTLQLGFRRHSCRFMQISSLTRVICVRLTEIRNNLLTSGITSRRHINRCVTLCILAAGSAAPISRERGGVTPPLYSSQQILATCRCNNDGYKSFLLDY